MDHPIEPRRPIPPAPIHPLAALVTVILDNVFGVFEFVDPFVILLTSLTVGTLGAVTTMLIQRYLAKEEWGPSVAKGLVMGIIAGVPFSVTGTAVGVPLLAWAGLHEWVRLPARTNPGEEAAHEIVDAEVKEVNDHPNP